MAVWICLPTYDERENLEPMVRALGEVIDTQRDRVLVIDDNSPDGTGELADRLAAELVVEIDCDFSHDPADVPRLIAACAEADLALGSRYVQGGGTENWGPLRRAVSIGGSWYARTVLGVAVRDITGGFKCFRRAVLERIGLDSITTRGYAFQIETTYRALGAGFRVVEVPILFADRRAGGSKMSRRIVLEAVWRVPAMRLRRLPLRP